MTCPDARRAMQTAERAELRAEGGSALAIHLRGCAACRTVAIRLEAGTDLLAEMVASRASAISPVPFHSRAPSRRRRVALLALLPISAAAAVLVVLVWREGPVSAPHEFYHDSVATHVAVDVQPGQTATVIKTANPNVTIVWLTPGGSE